MEETIKQYALKALAWVESGAMWIADEVPLYVEEIVKWHITKHAIETSAWLLLAISGIVTAIVFIKLHKSALSAKLIARSSQDANRSELPYFYYDIGWIYGLIYSGFAVFFGIPCMIVEIMSMLKAIVAPRVFLIEYLSSLL